MAKRLFKFHGNFSLKSDAKKKERSLGKGAFIRRNKIRGKIRYAVITKRG